MSAGIYATNSAEACEYVLSDCEANVVVVENHQQLVKILKIWDSLPHLKAIVQYTGEVAERRENIYSVSPGLQIYGGPGSLSHDFKIWPIIFQGSGPSIF